MARPTVSDSFESEFTVGCAACAGGQLRSTNPHAEIGSPAWCGWQKGWMYEFGRLPPSLQAARVKREPDLLSTEALPTGQQNA